MGILLCEQNFRDVWNRNETVGAEICQLLHTDTRTHTTAAKLVVRFRPYCRNYWLDAELIVSVRDTHIFHARDAAWWIVYRIAPVEMWSVVRTECDKRGAHDA